MKLFGRGEPDRVRHLKRKKNKQTQSISTVSETVSLGFITLNTVADSVRGTSGQFTTCVEEHSPQCPLAFQAKSAER